MKTILFQGDSITDCGRIESWNGFGGGYANYVTGEIGYKYVNEYKFINRGNSGNRIVDVYARIKKDILNHKPDYLSILIGINDVWHDLDEEPNGVSTPKFEKVYSMLLDEIFEELPNIKIMILEPFILPGTATDEYLEKMKPEVFVKAAVCKKLAEKYNCKFIPLQDLFTKLSEKTVKGYYSGDGVHPSPFGYRVIANEWIKAFEEIK